MGNETKVSTVMLGGALATLVLVLFGPMLADWRGEPLPPGVESALAVIFASILAWITPANILRRISKRTGSASKETKE